VSGFFSRFDRSTRKAEAGVADRSLPDAGTIKIAEANAAIEQGDRLRDSGSAAAAAEWYARALATLPDRNDVRVQLANMLKDSGQPAKAEDHYRAALTAEPSNADIALQLGRAMRMAGRIAEAAGMFERVLAIDPHLADAATELLHLGHLGADHGLYQRDRHIDRMVALLDVTAELTSLKASVDRALARVPDLSTWAAIPVERYRVLREMQDLPMPPASVDGPLVVVLVDADCGSPRALHGLIAGLRTQTNGDWQLLAVGGDGLRRDAVVRAGQSDPRVRWIERDEATTYPALPDDCWVLALRPGGMLHNSAIAWIKYLVHAGSALSFVFDEEMGRFSSRGVFSPETIILRSCADYDAELETPWSGETLLTASKILTGGGLQLIALLDRGRRAALRLSLIRSSRLGHFSLPIVQSLTIDQVPLTTRLQEHDAEVSSHLAQHVDSGQGPVARVARPGFVRARTCWHAKDSDHSIAVVVPTRDNGRDVEQFAESLMELAQRPDHIRLLIVDNGSRDQESLDSLTRLRASAWIDVLRIDAPFNWSGLNNAGASELKAETIVFANDDMNMLSAGWDEVLGDLLARKEVGVVGARLVYPDDTIQHAGVVAGWQGLVNNDGLRRHISSPGPCDRWHVTHAVAAVVGAFLATRRATFEQLGGFDAVALPIAFSDVDYCFKVRKQGLKVLYTPHITLRHHEAKSRGLDYTSSERQARYDSEQSIMEQRWPDALMSDPGVNPFWHDATLPFRLVQMPSVERLIAHVEATTREQPWRLT
jgi:GT2 family glycosyltransferase